MSSLKDIREFCFQYFFHLQLPIFEEIKNQLQNDDSEAPLIDSINEYKETANKLFDNQSNKKILNRLKGTLLNYSELEDHIKAHLKNWKIERLSKVDHTNLLLATYELCYEKETPTKVVINEAIEISKKFGTEDSSSFVNGILDNLAKSIRES